MWAGIGMGCSPRFAFFLVPPAAAGAVAVRYPFSVG